MGEWERSKCSVLRDKAVDPCMSVSKSTVNDLDEPRANSVANFDYGSP